jgi:hypothetical protein
VIGENPRLFGFGFDSPLAFLGGQSGERGGEATATARAVSQ